MEACSYVLSLPTLEDIDANEIYEQATVLDESLARPVGFLLVLIGRLIEFVYRASSHYLHKLELQQL